jgi:hypothetical protein
MESHRLTALLARPQCLSVVRQILGTDALGRGAVWTTLFISSAISLIRRGSAGQDDPREIVRRATRAVRLDSVPAVSRNWTRRLDRNGDD